MALAAKNEGNLDSLIVQLYNPIFFEKNVHLIEKSACIVCEFAV
jgi:hypothetical protein